MSYYYDYKCMTCNVVGGPSLNHGDNALRDAFRAWPSVRALWALSLWEIEDPKILGAELQGEPQPWKFLEAHDGHEIMLHSESGDLEPISEDDGRRGFSFDIEVSLEIRQRVGEELGLDHPAETWELRPFYRVLLQAVVTSGLRLTSRPAPQEQTFPSCTSLSIYGRCLNPAPFTCQCLELCCEQHWVKEMQCCQACAVGVGEEVVSEERN